ncbi:BCL5p [Apiospora aurea]|uniref:BCL5p n=1 Tax=Apiospora aurea TaxID=335848 RepID=A0ABR1QHC6_9PEZI
MDAHPLARRLPAKTGDKPSIHEGCRLFREFSIPSALPNNINHYFSTDEPLICLHIHSFTDGTLVSITFPHLLSDAMGTAGLLQAWSGLLRDPSHTSRVHLAGAREDVVAHVGTEGDKTARKTKFVLEDKQTTGIALFLFIARYAMDLWAHRNVETRHIYLPAGFVSRLRCEAKEEWMAGSADDSRTKPVPFLSDGDLITAWGARMVLSSASSKGSALICNVFDMRQRLLGLSAPSPSSSSSSYLQNLILPSTTFLDAEEARTLSTSQIARRVRRALVEQTTDAQVRSLMRIARAWFSRLGTMPLFARWDTNRVFACTNWSKARFFHHAGLFVPATTANTTVTTTPLSSHRKEMCKNDDACKRRVKKKEKKPLAFWGTTLAVHDTPRDAFVVYGQDHDGDYWVHAYLRKETWDLIQLELDQYGIA